ncbi:MAG: protein kinase, partial [Terriglobia bacterium]
RGITGTLPYMAPEQLRGEPVDARSDLWAAGAVLYEMATGRRPFEAKLATALAADMQHKPPQAPSHLNPKISSRLEEIILKCLEKDPEHRYQSARELLADFRRLTAPAVEVPRRRVPAGSARLLLRLGGVGVAVVVLLLAVLVGLNVGGWRERLFGRGPAPIESLAVLPLENLSGDPEQDYFADGMTEALIAELGKISALRVISRTSVMQYKGARKPLPEIARELNVDAVVEGSVLQIGDQVRITTQLIGAMPERHLWAQSYDRDLRNVLALHSEVARAIAREIKIAVTPEEEARLARTRSVNPEAYEAYLKGRVHWYKLSPQDIETAARYFELAREKDPDYALAYVGIGHVWGARGILGVVPNREALPRAKAAMLKALELDDTLAEAHNALAKYRTWGEWDWAGAEAEFQRAIELNPNNADTRVFYSLLLLTVMRRPQEARAQIERALELDPLNSFFQGVYGWQLMLVRQYDDAIAQVRKAHGTEPHSHVYALWVAFHQKRMYEEAVGEAKKYFGVLGHSEIVEALARGYAEAGYRGAMRLAAETLAARSKRTYILSTQVAALYAHAGQKDRALDWPEKAYQERDQMMVYLGAHPVWDSLRDDPRFQDLLRRMNFPE